MNPTENPKSECFECDAGMCHICSLKKNWDRIGIDDIYTPDPPQKKEPTVVLKQILRCYMCGWEHHKPFEWAHYEIVENGTMQKVCANCNRTSLLTKTIEYIQE
jgi:hypothetical protein